MDADLVWKSSRRAKTDRARLTPKVEDALHVMFEARMRLMDLGFQDICYAPKDGTAFESVSVGSTGIHETIYLGDWPTGGWFVAEAGDFWPANPCLFRRRKPSKEKPHDGNTD